MSKVWLKAVRVANFHGFSRGRLALKGLTDGLNVVYAPNATGKSTLAKAIGLLFMPGDCPPGASVSSELVENEVEIGRDVERKGQEYEGFPGKPESYRLDLVQLLRGLEKTEVPILEKIVANGVTLTVGAPPRMVGIKEVKEAVSQLQELRAARLKKASVAEQEDRLQQLRLAVEQAKEANDNLSALNELIRKRKLQEQKSEIEGEIQRLKEEHPGLERQIEDAIGTTKLLGEAITKALRDLERAETEFQRISPNGVVPQSDLLEVDELLLRQLVDQLSENIIEAESESRHLAELKIAAEKARDQILSLAPDEAPDSLPIPTERDVAALRNASSQADAVASHALRTETYRKMLEEWSNAQSPSNSEESLRLLRNWLEIEPTAKSDQRPLMLLAVTTVAMLVVAAVPMLALRIVVALLAATIAAFLVFGLRSVQTDDRRKEIEERFPKDLLQSEPSVASVSEAISRLIRFEAEAGIQLTLSTLIDQTAPADDWTERAARLRLKCNDPLLLGPVSQALLTYLDSQTKAAAQEQKLSGLRQSETELRAGIGRLLSKYGFPYTEGSELESARLFPLWFERSHALAQAKSSVEQAEVALAQRLDDFGIPPGHDLASRRIELSQREPLARELRELSDRERATGRDLESISPDEKRLATLINDDPEMSILEELVERQRALSQELSVRSMALAEAENLVKEAEKQSSIPSREADYQKAVGEVETKWKSLIRESVGRKAKQAIRDTLRKEELPTLIVRANDYARRFTNGRYKLAIAEKSTEGLGLLEVDDLERGRAYTFGELSTGTKVHIIVAIRLALIDEQERRANAGTRSFPLIADEVMAVSDPAASKAIAEALQEIAKDRQVIVFTNQPDDLRMFDGLATINTLGHEIVEQTAVIEVPEYRPPPALAIFDPRIPLRVHAPNAILPKSVWKDAKPPEYLSEASEEIKTLVEALEQIRRDLCNDNKRVSWIDVQNEPWAKTDKSADLQALIDKEKGCPHRMVAALKTLSGKSFNQNRQQQAREWLEESGYLTEPLSRETIRQKISAALAGADKRLIEHVTGVFAEAFVPISQLSLL